jgi:hypothetical protein
MYANQSPCRPTWLASLRRRNGQHDLLCRFYLVLLCISSYSIVETRSYVHFLHVVVVRI